MDSIPAVSAPETQIPSVAPIPSLKLKLKLGPKPTAAPSSPSPVIPVASNSAPIVPVAITPVKPVEKPKRKRSRLPPGVEGPGKDWRKGKKGNIVGVGAVLTAPTPGLSNSPQPPSRLSSAGPSRSKAPAAIVSSVVLDVSTPPVRAWNRSKKSFQSITGRRLALNCWQGNQHSAFSIYNSSNLAVPTTSVSPSKSSTPLPQV